MKRFIILLSFWFNVGQLQAQQPDTSSMEGKIHYYTYAGWEWSGHSGLDAGLSCIIRNRWFIGGRLWVNDYGTNQHPKLNSNGTETGYPYSHEEFAIQGGLFYALGKQWFVTAGTGPSYVRFFYPVGVDTFKNGHEIYQNMYIRDEKTALGLTFSGSINWHYGLLGLGISPQYFLNRLHSYAGVTVSAFLYINENE